ncbi:MAG TPA: hypothetical protein DC057_05445 [Spirochaetia bacterium]|nr:hypothetical protein [Spirochaetia bacterium]
MNTFQEIFKHDVISCSKYVMESSIEEKNIIMDAFYIYNPETSIIGILDDSLNGKMTAGIIFCDHYIFWNVSNSVYNKKKLDTGFISIQDFLKSTVSLRKKIVGYEINISNPESHLNLIIPSVSFTKTDMDNFNSFINEIKAQYNASFIVKESSYEIKKIERYVGKNNPEIILAYKKMFEKYDAAGGKFVLNFSLSGFLFGWFYLLHRKAYLEFVVYSVFSFIFATILSSVGFGGASILIWAFHGIVTPYLVYFRYRRVSKIIELLTIDEELKLKNYEMRGGTNILSGFILSILGFN